MTLTLEQQKKVEENMGLVGKVIQDKVHGPYQFGIYSRDDLFQIGCIGLCKAAATDRGGRFSTYAYRLIWNEICDALIYSSRRRDMEVFGDDLPFPAEEPSEELPELRMDLYDALEQAGAEAPPSTAKGIRAMVLMSRGYTSREIGEKMDASAKLVCAWVSKARKFLRDRPELRSLVEMDRA